MSLICGSFFFFEDVVEEFTIESDRKIDQKSNLDDVRNKDPLDQLWFVNVPHKPNKDPDRLLNVEFGLSFSRKEDQHVLGVVFIEYPVHVDGLNLNSPCDLAVLLIIN